MRCRVDFSLTKLCINEMNFMILRVNEGQNNIIVTRTFLYLDDCIEYIISAATFVYFCFVFIFVFGECIVFYHVRSFTYVLKCIHFRFFAHIGLEYLFTFWTCYMLYKEYDYVASMRLRFLASQHRRAEQFTVRKSSITVQLKKTSMHVIN